MLKYVSSFAVGAINFTRPIPSLSHRILLRFSPKVPEISMTMHGSSTVSHHRRSVFLVPEATFITGFPALGETEVVKARETG